MVAYTVETRLSPRQLEWEQLIAAACASAQVETGSAITAVSLTHDIAGLSLDEVETIIDLAGRLAADGGLSMETQMHAGHLTVRLARPGQAIQTSESVSFGALLRAILHGLNRIQERHS